MLKTDDFNYPPDNINFPKAEEEVLQYWKDIDAFARQQELTKDKPRFVFLDGPPFATGQPHYGHLLAGTIKDVVCRYQAQNGFYVPRRFGWDTHGLPVEQIINQKLNITSPEQVHQMGIDKYNAECRGAVMRYAQEWEEVVTRMGRWIDFRNDYKTLKPEFMETVWWVFKQLWDKNLVYQGIKVMPFSTALSSALSNFEANQNYKEDTIDPCCVVSFPIVGQENTYLTAWTTTPWTLPSNLALCVNAELQYVKVKDPESGKLYWIGEQRISELYPPKKGQKGPTVEIVDKCLGKDLVGLRYEPLFKYFEHFLEESPKIWTVLQDSYVTSDSGTGIVHQAPYFGEDDYRVCLAHGVIRADSTIVCPVNECGCFTAQVTDYQGLYVKDADKTIMKDLKARGRLLKQGTIKHSYPFCYRSDTPLIYKAVPSWFVRVERIKDRMLENNMKSQWVPDFVQHKRFHNWIAAARDWAISRDRFWGCPIPVWRSADGEVEICISSREDLCKQAGIDPAKVTDLHREFIDDITIPDPRGGDREPLRRITQVFDCWFESGSMPYGQIHYPFESLDNTTLENGLPGTTGFKTSGEGGLADFIAEGLDQTRGWFYTLLILSTCLFDRPPATHCIVNGLVLASNGQKMSKRLQNYDPVDKIISSYGADAIRLYLCKSPAVRALEIRFDSSGVQDVVKALLLQWFNAFRFFSQQVCRQEKNTNQKFVPLTLEEMIAQGDQLCMLDKWMLQNLGELANAVHKGMEEYKLYIVFPRVVDFIDDLTKWYIRFHRDVLKSSNSDKSLSVLCYLLFQLSVLIAPYAPFFSEYTYQRLLVLLKRQGKPTYESVHFCQVPVYQKGAFAFDDPRLTVKMQRFKRVIMLARQCRRDRCGVTSFKTPLAAVSIVHANQQNVDDLQGLIDYIASELNVLEVKFHVGEEGFGTVQLDPDFAEMRNIITDKAMIGKAAKALTAFQKQCKPEHIQALREGKSVEFDGVEITPQFCAVKLVPERQNASADDSGFLVEFDLQQSAELVERALERLIISKINKGRKDIGAQLGDVVNVAICYCENTDVELLEKVVAQLSGRTNGQITVKKAPEDTNVEDADTIELGNVTCFLELTMVK